MVKGDRSLDVRGREVREMRNAETILGSSESAADDDCHSGSLSTTVQPGPVPALLRPHLSERWGHDERERRPRPWTGCRWEDRRDHRARSPRELSMVARATGLHPERKAAKTRSGSPPGRTSCCKTWSAPSWRRTTSRSSPTTPTASGRDAAATPRCARSRRHGRDEVVHRGRHHGVLQQHRA